MSAWYVVNEISLCYACANFRNFEGLTPHGITLAAQVQWEPNLANELHFGLTSWCAAAGASYLRLGEIVGWPHYHTVRNSCFWVPLPHRVPLLFQESWKDALSQDKYLHYDTPFLQRRACNNAWISRSSFAKWNSLNVAKLPPASIGLCTRATAW